MILLNERTRTYKYRNVYRVVMSGKHTDYAYDDELRSAFHFNHFFRKLFSLHLSVFCTPHATPLTFFPLPHSHIIQTKVDHQHVSISFPSHNPPYQGLVVFCS